MAIRQIRADGSGDFTTLAAWIASLPGTLFEDEIAEIAGTIDATGAQTHFTPVTSPAARIIIRAAAGQETTFSSGDGKARINFGAFDLRISSASSQHVTIENISIYLGFNSGNRGIQMDAAPAGADWRWMNLFIARGGTNQTAGLVQQFPGLLIENSIILGLRSTRAALAVWRNCTFIAGFEAVDPGGATAESGIFDRCYFANNTNALGQLFSEDGGSVDLAFSDDNSGRVTPTISFASLADQYADAANGDWSFKAGNVLEGAGVGGADIGFVQPGGAQAPPVIEGGGSFMVAGMTGIAAARLHMNGVVALIVPASLFDGSADGPENSVVAAIATPVSIGVVRLLLNGSGAAEMSGLIAALSAASRIAGVIISSFAGLRASGGTAGIPAQLTAAPGRTLRADAQTRRIAIAIEDRRLSAQSQGRKTHV